MWTAGSVCSGIGGLDLAIERCELARVVWQIEIDPFPRSVLERHWPEVRRYEDVCNAHPAPVDVMCAGFPCQPVSVAGRRRAQKDERWLWPEVARLIGECEPRVVIIENVPGLRTAGLRDVLVDLAALGYDAEWTHFTAAHIGAPHKRDRFWLLATAPDRVQLRHEPGWLERAIRANTAPEPGLLPADADRVRRLEQALRLADQRGWSELCGWRIDPVAGVDDGLPGRLGAARKALGNSVVVPCAELVIEALKEVMGCYAQKEAA